MLILMNLWILLKPLNIGCIPRLINLKQIK